MNKILFLVLFFSQIFVFFCGCTPDYPYYIGYTLDCPVDQACSSYVIDVSLEGHSGVHFEFTTYNEAISVWTTLYIGYEPDTPYNLFPLIPANSKYSKSYFFSSKYDSMRISVQSLYSNYYKFTIYTSFDTISSFAAWIIILIVIGALVCLAVVSMGIAKAMGRSAWEGLACFCIICTLCCCRR
jgi:hypothetical protein